MGKKYSINICWSCGVDLDDNNWTPWLKKRRKFKCRTCFNNKMTTNIDIFNFVRNHCIICNCALILNQNWKELNKNSSSYYCVTCQNNKSKIDRLDIKSLIQNGYDGKCNCCGENAWQFLTIDHIFNDGAVEKKEFSASKLFRNLINLNYPKDRYQLLCMNCNYSKGSQHFCPHQIKNKGNNCYYCNCVLDENNTFKFNLENNYAICKYCTVNLNKKSNSKILDSVETYYSKKSKLKLKQDIFENYGGKCECCGEDEFYFMTIDHINGRGENRIHKDTRSIDASMNTYLRQNNYPKDEFRLFCYNCNCSRGLYGKCYHELNREHGKIITIEDYKQLVMNNLV